MRQPTRAGSCTDALRLLRGLGEETTTGRFLHEILTARYSGEENSELHETAATLSPATLHGWLPEFTAAALPRHPEAVLDLLRKLCEQELSRSEQGDPWGAALRDAARSACRVLPEVVRAGAGSDTETDFLEDGDRFRIDASAQPFRLAERAGYSQPVRAHLAR